MGLPRGKRTLYDTGLHEPLIVRFPEEVPALGAGRRGADDRPPGELCGFRAHRAQPVRSPAAAAHAGRRVSGPARRSAARVVYGARDRVDEAYDLARSVRDRRYLYIRNYAPHLSWNQPEGFSDNAPMRQEITQLAAAGQLNAAQLTYAGPAKPLEELYDTAADPHQVHNLAASPEHREVLERMRQAAPAMGPGNSRSGVPARSGSLAAVCGPHAVAAGAGSRLVSAGTSPGRGRVGRSWPRRGVRGRSSCCRIQDAGVRYWAAVGLQAAGRDAAPARDALRLALADRSPSVQVAAAGGVGVAGRRGCCLADAHQTSPGRATGRCAASRENAAVAGRTCPACLAGNEPGLGDGQTTGKPRSPVLCSWNSACRRPSAG